MRIASNTVSENLVNQITQLSNQQVKLQAEVSTGRRISQPEDDPAAIGRVLVLQAQQAQLNQYAANATRALNLSQATYSGLTAFKKISDRATEIGTLGSGALSPEQRNAYAAELDQLIEQAVQNGNSKLGNDYLYSGTAVTTAPYVATRNAAGQITSVAYAGNAQQSTIPLSDTSTVAPGTDNTTNLGLRDFINNLISLRDAFVANNPAGVTSAQTSLITTEDTLVSAIADQGAVQSRIEANQSQQKDLSTSLSSLISTETDADLPTTITKLTQAQTAYQAALQSTASIMRTSLLDYIK